MGAAGGPAAGVGSDTPTSGGWAPVDAGGYDVGWYDPYGYDWGLPATTEWWPGPYEAWSVGPWSGTYGASTPGRQPVATEAQEASGVSAVETGSGVTAYWHGNPGY